MVDYNKMQDDWYETHPEYVQCALCLTPIKKKLSTNYKGKILCPECYKWQMQ